MEISRREFLKYLGVATAGFSITASGCDSIWSVPDEIIERVGGAPHLETWKMSVCSLCTGGCGLKVRLIDGIPVRMLGNPTHPVNRGGICPMAEAGIENLFNPDRIKNPKKRIGERGANKWQDISWDEALETVSARLQKLRAAKESHKLLLLSDKKYNLLMDLLQRFMQAFGSPNLYYFDKMAVSRLATRITQGHKWELSYDFSQLQLLINFGAELLDSGPAPVRFNQLYSQMRNRRQGHNARIIHIGSSLSRTAGHSSQWLPIRPGTMGALALGMANVLIKDGQYDKVFIKNNSFGFADWQDKKGIRHKGFKSLVQQNYAPVKVAKITGIPAARIVELAREFAEVEPALVIAGEQATTATNSLYTLWAIDCLNALKGNYKGKQPVSLVSPPPLTKLEKLRTDQIAASGLMQPRLTEPDSDFCFTEFSVTGLPKSILDGQPYPVDTLFLIDVNPIFHAVNQKYFTAALKKIPFIVSFASFLDETSLYADIVLPRPSFLEMNEVFTNVPTVHFKHIGVQQPVIQPLYQTRQVGDVLLQLGRSLEKSVSSALPWQDYEAYLKARVENVYKTGIGTIFTERMDVAWLQFLKKRGWQMFEYSTFDEFWNVLREKGGWWDPFPEQKNLQSQFKTPSGKFEFYSQILQRKVESNLRSAKDLDSRLQKWQITSRGDDVFLPHFEYPQYENKDNRFTLNLLTFNLITNNNGTCSNLPLIQELFGLWMREYWQSWCELNPDTAKKHKIHEGNLVKVISKEGALIVKAKIHPGVMPGVVQIPFGLGHTALGQFARGVGVNPYEILTENFDYLSGAPSLMDTKVRLEKVKRKELA